jgi:hypothetical protein
MGTATISKKVVETTLNSPDFQLIMREMMADWLKNNPAAMRDALLSALRETGYEAKPVAPKVDYGSEAFAKKHAIKWEAIQELQKIFKDTPPTEEWIEALKK